MGRVGLRFGKIRPNSPDTELVGWTRPEPVRLGQSIDEGGGGGDLNDGRRGFDGGGDGHGALVVRRVFEKARVSSSSLEREDFGLKPVFVSGAPNEIQDSIAHALSYHEKESSHVLTPIKIRSIPSSYTF